MKKRFFPPFTRKCPSCERVIEYTNVKNRNQAERHKKTCHSCSAKEVSKRPEIRQRLLVVLAKGRQNKRKTAALPPFLRLCPICHKRLEYSTVKHRNKAEKINSKCGSCSAKIISENTNYSDRFKNRRKYTGDQNPFYGKHHSDKVKEILKNVNKQYTQTDDFKKKSARIGKKNGMYGKSVYDVWTKKYGDQKAKEKWIQMQHKKSIKMSGTNNPMYGKPAPIGSGSGWSGWYKKWYFRSLRELSYLILVIEANNRQWESADKNKFAISYVDHLGVKRTYRPDFLVDKKHLIEVKPAHFMNTPINILKKEAALKFCQKNGLKFHVVDSKILNVNTIIDLYNRKEVEFNKKYNQRIQEICRKKRIPVRQ